MISNYDIKKIIEDCAQGGAKIKVRDIAFVLLSLFLEDKVVAYRSVFQEEVSNDAVAKYNASNSISYLRTHLEQNYLKRPGSVKVNVSSEGDLSFEQNKAEMVGLIKQTEQAMKSGELEKKDGLKIIADLRVKLNDKFKVADDSKDSLVVVETKYNGICEGCGREVYIPTKEQLMKKYGLIEKVDDEERDEKTDR